MKYLLCRPLGGLNDILCQINNCYNYCEKNSRCLLIDTSYNSFFRSSFSDYFTFLNNIKIDIIYDSNTIKELINGRDFTVFPSILTNKLFNYRVEFRERCHRIVDTQGDKTTNIPSNINFKQEYDEDIIVHNECGGGLGSFNILKLLKINKWLIDEINNRHNKIEKPYTSVHIRNTDYQTNYIDFYNKNKSNLDDRNVFLATDSKEVLDYYKNLDIKIFTFITCLNETNRPIHLTVKNNDTLVIIETIYDLMILALGDNFILPTQYYGFTRLAYTLYNNKNVVNQLLQIE